MRQTAGLALLEAGGEFSLGVFAFFGQPVCFLLGQKVEDRWRFLGVFFFFFFWGGEFVFMCLLFV